MATVPPDIEIAQQAKPRPIVDVAADLGLAADDIDLYGKYKAKVPLESREPPAARPAGARDRDQPDGRW